MNLSECLSCGNANPIGANFCAACGSRFPSSQSAQFVQSPQAAPYGMAPSRATVSEKPKKPRPSGKRITVLSAAAAGLGLALSGLIYFEWNHNAEEPERRAQAAVLAESKVKFGLLVRAVAPSSPTESSGLVSLDIITAYNGLPVRDTASYVAAAEAGQPGRRVTLTVWRDGGEVKLTAPAGYLRFAHEDWNPTRKSIYQNLSAGNLKTAEQLVATAERDGSLTEVQAMIVRIVMIPNRSSVEDEKQRSKLLDSLLSVYPMTNLNELATREFMDMHSYAAAARCYDEQLQRYDPEDVDVRLNLACCYVSLFDFDKAERHVHYVTDRPDPRLSPHGYLVVRSILGGIAMGRGKYHDALQTLSRHLEDSDDYTGLLCLLGAARLGDLAQFRELRDQIRGEVMTRIQVYVDVLEAYLLLGTGRNSDAAALVNKWGQPVCVADNAASYWGEIPGGSDIATRLKTLLPKG